MEGRGDARQPAREAVDEVFGALGVACSEFVDKLAGRLKEQGYTLVTDDKAIEILGTLGFGKVGMGRGDADLMFCVGTVLGAGPVVIAFFMAPFFGILIALYMLLFSKQREMPYGPYLSLASGFVMIAYCPIADYFGPGLTTLIEIMMTPRGIQ